MANSIIEVAITMILGVLVSFLAAGLTVINSSVFFRSSISTDYSNQDSTDLSSAGLVYAFFRA